MSPPITSDLRPAPEIPELLSRARAISEFARERAQQTEANRRISDEIAGRIRDAGLFRILQPRARGGYEYPMQVLVEATAIIGQGCGSTAWVYGVCSLHQWFVACMQQEAQDEFWTDRDAFAAGSYSPVGRTLAVDGGFRVSGAWSFTSGCDNAQWYFLGAVTPPADAALSPRPMFVLVPRADVRLEDTWHTVGLAGTGSKTVVADDIFVPAHRTLAFDDMRLGQGPGTAINTNPLYRQSFLAVLPTALVAPVLGMAESALSGFIDAVKVRSTRGAVAGGNRRMAELGSIQARVAEATGSIDAARLMIFRDLSETHAIAVRGEPTPLDVRLRNRLHHAFTMRLLVQAVDTLFTATGGQGLHLDIPMQRQWRDTHAAASHISISWDAVGTMYGQYALGLEPQGQY